MEESQPANQRSLSAQGFTLPRPRVSEAASRTGVPLLFGVITVDNIEQADERSRDDQNNKGHEAAMAAIEVANLYRSAFRSDEFLSQLSVVSGRFVI